MMIIISSQAIYMQRDPRRLRKALHAMRYHLAAQISNLLPLEPQINHTEGAEGDIDYSSGERFVERAIGGSEAGDSYGGAEGGCEGGSESDADVFCGVVVVDCCANN